MKRTQMYFDEGDWGRIQARAEASGRSAAAVVRDAVAEYLSGNSAGDDPILELIREAEAGCADGPPTHGVRDHDHYLYGWPREDDPWPERNG